MTRRYCAATFGILFPANGTFLCLSILFLVVDTVTLPPLFFRCLDDLLCHSFRGLSFDLLCLGFLHGVHHFFLPMRGVAILATVVSGLSLGSLVIVGAFFFVAEVHFLLPLRGDVVLAAATIIIIVPRIRCLV